MKKFVLNHLANFFAVRWLFGYFGVKVELVRNAFKDVPTWQHEIYRKVIPYTMCSAFNVYSLLRQIEHLEKNKIPGAIVECGVWRGGMIMAAILGLQRFGGTREIYLFDTFDGMTPPGPKDEARAHEIYEKQRKTYCRVQFQQVADALAQCPTYPPELIHFVKGPVENTIPPTPGPIALLHLDTDWYESTRHELTWLEPLVSPGGFVIVDDYEVFKGSRAAIDEYLKNYPEIFLHRVDFNSRYFIKPHPRTISPERKVRNDEGAYV